MGGMRSRFKKAFLRAHPLCCFCGGERQSTTIDHQPSESVYPEWTDRHLKLVFPACSRCNAASRKAESLLPLILSKEPPEGERDLRFEELVRRQSKWKPERIRAMVPTTREIRNILNRHGLQPPPGVLYGDLPILQLDQGEWRAHLEVMSRKMILALHYRYAGKPLSHRGRIAFHRYFNFDALNDLVPPDIISTLELVQMDPEASHIAPELEVGHSMDEGLHAYIVNLRNKILLVGVSAENAGLLQAPTEDLLFAPFDWETQ